MHYSNYNDSPYATSGGLARQPSLARQQSIRNSTGSISNNPGRSALDPYSQQGGPRPASSQAYGQRASNSGSGAALYSNNSGGASVLPGASQRPSSPGRWGPGAKVPLSHRLAQVKAVYSATKLTHSMDSFRRSDGADGAPRTRGEAMPRREGQRPTGFTCYLCGQQYGSQSLMVHIPQCQKKWVMVEAQKPRGEQRPLPPMPPELERGVLPTRPEEVEEFNSRMYTYWDKVSLVACPICARTFRPDAFERHAKVCTPDNPGGPLGPNKHAPPPRPKSAARMSGVGNGGGGGRGGSGGGFGGGGGGGGGAPRGAPSPARVTGQRPTGFTCYLCGQQYGSQSLMVHIPQCQKKWVMVEAQKPRREQRPLPPMPPELERGVLPTRPEEVEEFNSRMYSYWDKVSLVACPICARTFRPDAFERHAKVCTPDNPGGPLGPNKHAPQPRPGAGGGGGGGGMGGRPSSAMRSGGAPARRDGERPRAYMCYLCGQQFGSQSLTIHIPQCYEKWLKVEATKPPKERRQPPPPPPELDQPLPTTSQGIDEFNSRMSAYFNGASLMPCPNCGRTMRPDALRAHMKACTADKPMARSAAAAAAGGGGAGGGGFGGGRSAAGGGGGGPSEYDELDPGELELCANCGRKMRPDALAKHQRMCTADKPMKPLRTPGGPSPTAGRPASGAVPGRAAGGGNGGGGGGSGNGIARNQGRGGGGSDQPDENDDGPEPPKVSYDLPPDADGYDDDGGEARVQCGTCGRRFLPEAYEKHSRVCAKVFAGKRKVFNSAAKRVGGTDAAAFHNPRAAQRPAPPAGPAPAGGGRPRPGSAMGRGGGPGDFRGGGGKPAWKAQSEQLRQAMREMRKVGAALARGEDIRNIPHVPSAPDPSLVQCPNCGRRFNAQAAERHIPRCASIISKPKFLKAGTGGAGRGAPDSKQLPRW
ncbi:hypothetical protein Vretimale_4597 [Volvox reticuliferus]|uniref:C2HC/C3H-type domain-containing protein n=3 Tax=Volvox reticuliferus TaxID=1737510 RepID=A0A8J4C0H6_9CHLO|nr:hypothetical protein Vretifemale_3192 [Volvox reticuliferus]GIL99432.1 hypothetical protein Vretimale_4597 [Volvox reticuliferus]